MFSNNVSPNSSSPYKGVDKSGRNDSVESYRSRDDSRNDNFKKVMDEKNGEHSSGEEENSKTSVFDLTKKGTQSLPTKPKIKSIPPQQTEDLAEAQLQKSKRALAKSQKTPTTTNQESEITLQQLKGKKPGSDLIAQADVTPSKSKTNAITGKASSGSAGEQAESGLAKNKFSQEISAQDETVKSQQKKPLSQPLSKESEQESSLVREELSASGSQGPKKEKTIFELASEDSTKQVQPIIGQAYTAAESHIQQNQAAPMPSPAKAVEEIARQIVDAVHLMRFEGRTDTIVTLRHPPILAGSQVTLTTFEHAKGEFNISFSNLSSQAKTFLDQQLAQHNLQDSLERKGIVVHTLTTTTQVENPLAMRAEQAQRDQDQQQQQQQQQQQRQQQQEQEEETE